MSDYNDNRRPEEIESDIERSRADVSSTIDAIQSKLTPGQLMDQAFGYARTSVPADFGANLGNAVRDNPVPITLIGVGLAWLMASGRKSDGQARARRQAIEQERDYYSGDSELEHESAYGIGADAATPHESSMHRATSKVGETGRNLKDKASDLKHRLSDKASALTGRARDMAGGARQKMSGSSGDARARMGQVSQRSQQQYYRAKDSFGRLIDEQPLMLGALGVAIGTILGAALPATRREDELMGRTRDDLLDRTKDTARDQAENVKQSAQRVAKVAEQEVERVASEAKARSSSAQSQTSASDSLTSGGTHGQQFPH